MKKGAGQEENSKKELLCHAKQMEEGARIFLVVGNTSGLRVSPIVWSQGQGEAGVKASSDIPQLLPGALSSPQAEEPTGDDAVRTGGHARGTGRGTDGRRLPGSERRICEGNTDTESPKQNPSQPADIQSQMGRP